MPSTGSRSAWAKSFPNFTEHGAVHGAGGWGQALRMQRADHRPSGKAGPARPRAAARWPGARPPDAGCRRDGPAWAAMSRLVPPCAALGCLVPPCAALCHLVPLISDHLVPLCATLCRRRPEWAALKPFRAKRRRSGHYSLTAAGRSLMPRAFRRDQFRAPAVAPLIRRACRRDRQSRTRSNASGAARGGGRGRRGGSRRSAARRARGRRGSARFA